MSNKRAMKVSVLTLGIAAGIIATAVGPAAAQGNAVGGSGSVYFLSGAGSTGGAAQKVIAFGDPGDETFFGDWDGNGTDTPMIRRGNVFRTSDDNGNLQNAFAYGDPGDKVVIGDWDGDGKDSIAVQRGNHFLVKNDSAKSSVADTDFYFGDNGDTVLAGDWDGNGTDTLAVQRGNHFFVKNDTKTGVADFDFYFGDPGDKVLVGDWANPATGTSGNGADQLAVQRDNHFFLSADLGKDGKGGQTTMRDFYYGDPGDQVFVAKLPTPVIGADGKQVVDTKHLVTYASDVAATYQGGEPVLQKNSDGSFTQKTDANGTPMKHKAGDPVVHFAGDPQVYLGMEPVVTASGKTEHYVKFGTAAADLAEGDVAIPNSTSTVEKFHNGDYVLDANGNFIWVKKSDGTFVRQTWTNGIVTADGTTKALPADNTIKVSVGDVVRYQAGQAIEHLAGTPAVYEVGNQSYTADSPVILHAQGDYVLTNGQPTVAPSGATADANGFAIYPNTVYLAADGKSTTADSTKAAVHKAGDKVTRRAGEQMVGYHWNGTGWDQAVNEPVVIPNDEAADWYLNRTFGDGTTAPKAGDGHTAAPTNSDTIPQPEFYAGGETVLYGSAAVDDLSVAPDAGGESVVAHKAGDPMLDANGNQQYTGDDKPEFITGDGLGVRRNY